MFEKSILVVAHLDDEVLWFSSILDKVDQIVVCYLGVKSHPEWTDGRKKSLMSHPLSNLTCLGLDESEVFEGPDWENPVVTEHGMAIQKKQFSDEVYKQNFKTLKERLESKLAGYQNVFTHNPWGEYGHVEHVQVFRIVKDLQIALKFNLWFSNYCSNKSFNLMLNYVSGFNSNYITLPTDKKMGQLLMQLYTNNNCWTWYSDYRWFNEEAFMKDKQEQDGITLQPQGHIFPLNMIKVWIPGNEPGLFKRVYSVISAMVKKLI